MKTKPTLILITLFIFSIISFGQTEIKVYTKFVEFQKAEFKNVEKNKIKVINFWATWCVPCVKELPYFEAINKTKISGIPVEVTLASLDFEKNLKSRVVPFIEKKNLKTKVVLLTDGNADKWINKIDENWSGAIPATYIIYNGHHYFFEKDYNSLEELQTEIKTIIKQN